MAQQKAAEGAAKIKNSPGTRLARAWAKDVPHLARRIALLLLAAVVLGLMFSGLSAISAPFVRAGISVLILAVILALKKTARERRMSLPMPSSMISRVRIQPPVGVTSSNSSKI